MDVQLTYDDLLVQSSHFDAIRKPVPVDLNALSKSTPVIRLVVLGIIFFGTIFRLFRNIFKTKNIKLASCSLQQLLWNGSASIASLGCLVTITILCWRERFASIEAVGCMIIWVCLGIHQDEMLQY